MLEKYKLNNEQKHFHVYLHINKQLETGNLRPSLTQKLLIGFFFFNSFCLKKKLEKLFACHHANKVNCLIVFIHDKLTTYINTY